MQMNQVDMVSCGLIEPSCPVIPSKYELTGLDRIMQHVPYQKRVLFYAAVSQPVEDVVLLLKKTLAQVLVVFYPLAGRIRSGDGFSEPALELDCTQLSVRFSEAMTESSLSDLGDFEPSAFCDSLCEMGCSPQHPWTPDIPLLFVQVTKFACGGLSIGFSFSHQIMDGVSSWHFMSSWAESARTGVISGAAPEVAHGYKQRELGNEMVTVGRDTKSDACQLPEEELQTKVYRLERAEIEQLKLEAGRHFSAFEVVCACFWRRLVLAKGLSDTSSCRFMVLVDCRGRIKSLPSKTYFGNAVWSAVATAEVGRLTAGEGLSYAATLLHEAIARFDTDTAEAKFHQRRGCRPAAAATTPGGVSECPDRSFTVVAVESPRQPVYECDFGFGRPVGLGFGRNDLHEGKIYLFPLAPGGNAGVSVTVVMRSEAIQALI